MKLTISSKYVIDIFGSQIAPCQRCCMWILCLMYIDKPHHTSAAGLAPPLRCSGISASFGTSLSTASPIYDGNLTDHHNHSFVNTCFCQSNWPGYPVLGKLLEAIGNDRPDFGRLLALFVAQARTDVECLHREVNDTDDHNTILTYLPRLHLTFKRTSRSFMPTLPKDVARNYSFSIVESLFLKKGLVRLTVRCEWLTFTLIFNSVPERLPSYCLSCILESFENKNDGIGVRTKQVFST